MPLEAPTGDRSTIERPAVESFPSVSLTWTYSVAAGNRVKLLSSFGIVAITTLAAYFLFHSAFVALLAGIALFFAVADALLPLTYTLARDGATVNFGQIEFLEIRRESIKSIYRTESGLKLSVFAAPNRALSEHFRGVNLRFPHNRAREVEAFLEREWNIGL